jgi:hypothetical protein
VAFSFTSANPVGLQTCRDMAYASALGRIVAVGAAEDPGHASINVVYSDDGGVSWASGNGPTGEEIHAVCWSSVDAQFVLATTSGTIYHSANGTSWTQQLDGGASPIRPLGFNTINRITYGNGKYMVAVSRSGTNAKIAHTTDPTSTSAWTTVTTSTALDTGGIAWVFKWIPSWSLWVAAGRTSSLAILITSPDLSAWTVRTTGIDGSFSEIYEVTDSSVVSKVVACGYSPTSGHGQAWASTADPATWTRFTLPLNNASGGWGRRMIDAGTKLVAVGTATIAGVGKQIYECTVLGTWTADPSSNTYLDFGYCGVWDGTHVVAGGNGRQTTAGAADAGAALINPWSYKRYVAGQLATPTVPNGHTYKCNSDNQPGHAQCLLTSGTATAWDPASEPVWSTDGSVTIDGSAGLAWSDLGNGFTVTFGTWTQGTFYGFDAFIRSPTNDGHVYTPYPGAEGTSGSDWPFAGQANPWTSPFFGDDGNPAIGSNFPAGGLDPTDNALSGFDGTVLWQDLGPFAPPGTVVSIEVTPVESTVGYNVPTQFTATATYDDDTTGDVTSTAVWTSSDPAEVSVVAGGEATGHVPHA